MVNVPAFFKDRRKVAAIIIAIIAILAIIIATWLYTPDLWVSAGVRRDPKLVTYVDALHSLVMDQHPQNLTTWRVTWLNSTSVKVTWGYTYYGIVNATASNQTAPAAENATGNIGVRVVNTTANATQANVTGNNTQLIHYDETFVMTNFFGTNAASSYVNRTNANYTLMNTTYPGSGAYKNAFGRSPFMFAEYRQVKGPQGLFIWQFDQFVQVGSCVRTYGG